LLAAAVEVQAPQSGFALHAEAPAALVGTAHAGGGRWEVGSRLDRRRDFRGAACREWQGGQPFADRSQVVGQGLGLGGAGLGQARTQAFKFGQGRFAAHGQAGFRGLRPIASDQQDGASGDRPCPGTRRPEEG
jgi:hypothetical protein